MILPRIVIAGTSSGVGKTSISLGIARAVAQRGQRVQTFKVGPDFLDPLHLAGASGTVCYNLDSWMTGTDYIQRLFTTVARDADISIIEGVMGMFDGADPAGIAGSTAEIAATLDSPVILVINTHGMSGSIAPVVKGFRDFHPDVTLAGAIANNCGSLRHVRLLRDALHAAGLPPLVGAIPRDSLPRIPDRHLGLVTPGQTGFPEDLFSDIASAVSSHVDLDMIVALARSAPALTAVPPAPPTIAQAPLRRIGVAKDKAFFFYYPDNLRLLEAGGAELVEFSPLTDTAVPRDLDALYIGGGYPEEYAEQLSANGAMRDSVRNYAESGGTVYAECGGFMYLGESMATTADRTFAMTGVIPVSTRMLPRLKTLGYADVTLAGDSVLGREGTKFRGHEFHYSDLSGHDNPPPGWSPAYVATNRAGNRKTCGFRKGNILAGYMHLHFGSNVEAAGAFAANAKQESP